MEKICPKCEKKFECRHDEIEKCDCRLVRLSGKQLEYVKENFNGCLCLGCLREISKKDV